VFVEGRLKLDQWTDKDGSKRSKMRVVIENFQFIGGPAGEGGARGASAARTNSGTQDIHTPTGDDDIPF
jgi:single-strand DNA-binding protein